jgi:drug/metabolite transporter (DMT)-like permease
MNNPGAMGLMILLNQAMNVGATTGFALSGNSQTAQRFVFWQIFGSVFGLGTQLSFAGLVRFSSLEFANAIGIGLAFVSAQVFSAYVYFRVPFTGWQWFGTALVFAGIACIALGK